MTRLPPLTLGASHRQRGKISKGVYWVTSVAEDVKAEPIELMAKWRPLRVVHMDGVGEVRVSMYTVVIYCRFNGACRQVPSIISI